MIFMDLRSVIQYSPTSRRVWFIDHPTLLKMKVDSQGHQECSRLEIRLNKAEETLRITIMERDRLQRELKSLKKKRWYQFIPMP
jgi:hypothetical protein